MPRIAATRLRKWLCAHALTADVFETDPEVDGAYLGVTLHQHPLVMNVFVQEDGHIVFVLWGKREADVTLGPFTRTQAMLDTIVKELCV